MRRSDFRKRFMIKVVFEDLEPEPEFEIRTATSDDPSYIMKLAYSTHIKFCGRKWNSFLIVRVEDK